MDYREAEKKWGVAFPAGIERIGRKEANRGVMIDNQATSLPWPPLSASEILLARDAATDWKLEPAQVPVMGDFHDLVCLDYTKSDNPEVIIINDEREILVRYTSLEQFLRSLIIVDNSKEGENGAIENESWLDIQVWPPTNAF